MDVPPDCRTLDQDVRQLIELTSGWPIEDSGFPKPGLGEQLRALADKEAALAYCIAQHPRGYQTQVVVRDLSTGEAAPLLPVRAVRWDLAPASGLQHVLEIEAVQDEKVSFWGSGAAGPDRSIGVSVHDAPNLQFPGPLFRSGALPALPPSTPENPAGLIEIVIPRSPPPIQGTTINSALPAVGTVLSTSPVVKVVDPPPTVSLTADTEDTPGTATLVLSCTVELPPAGTVPFQFSVTFRITPSADMNDATKVARADVTTDATVTTSTTGPIAAVFALTAQTLVTLVRPQVLDYLNAVLNDAIRAAIAAAFGFPVLPPDVIVSMRRIAVHSTEVSVFPALGAFGGLSSVLPQLQ